MYRAGILALLLLFGTGSVAHAQIANGDPLVISIDPSYPRPYDVVRVTVSSQLLDLSSATIKLSVNGKVVSTYSGTEAVPIQVGGPGQINTISASATVGGKTYTKKLSVGTGDVSLVTDAQSTAHPFYEGGLLVAAQGNVRIIALADLRSSKGTRLDPATLVYTWKLNNQVLQGDSGIGKSILTAIAPVRYRDATISVTVTSQDQSVVAQASTIISPVDPVLRIYPADPLRGVDFFSALSGSFTLAGSEETFRAVPYFFGATPAFTWGVNGQQSGTTDTVTVRQTGSGAGRANLSLSTRLAAVNQSVSSSLNLVFGSQNSTNIFGF